ncbi:hypothetical protein E4U30_004397 [Claviceps sp. LM220 group G6]|nr:hypothetical protein E4U15_006367 [Claviceps sp. LM218 group G6]KAG6100577.1 hypothetical protein E4U30_004397 [Claviceps sp. LM220 group G6]
MNVEHDPIEQGPIRVEGNRDEQLSTNDIHFVGRDACGKCLRPLRFDSMTTIPNIIFDSENTLRIEQRVHKSDQQCGRQLHVFGRLDICSSGESSNRGRVEIKIVSGDKKLTAATKIHFDDHFIDISTPFLADWWDKIGPKPCVKLVITVYVPCDSQIDILEVKVDSLDVSVIEGLRLKVADKMSITTFSGNVRVPLLSRTGGRTSDIRLNPREMLIQTYSGAIEGGFLLHDLLKIKSGSGSVIIELGLASTDPASATSAKLSVETDFGNIRIMTPLIFYFRQSRKGFKNRPPSRDYVVDLETTSGKIEADVVVASRATIRSRAGDVVLRLVPVPFSARGNGKTTVVTDVDYGKTRVFLLESSYSGAPCANNASSTTDLEATNTSNSGLAGLHSSHRSISGDIKVDVPNRWSGEFIADTHTGDITAYGKNMTIMRSSQGAPRMMEGLRGSRDSSVRMKSLWGSLELFVSQP